MTQLRAGELYVNRFEIDQAAGRGGMGVVYRARDRRTGGIVALKLLHTAGGDIQETERFLREAHLLAELRHPGIVAYVAHGQSLDGQQYLAMEWLDGEDLAHRLARGPLSLREALLVIQRTAAALATAHQCGIVHRDIKPTNLFLRGGDLGLVKVLDFGIARRLATSSGVTHTGVVIGTPEYMAPEQARGLRDLTAAADIFSLGCVLYECLTGNPPFVAEHIAGVLVRILFEEPPDIESQRPGIPAAVTDLLRQMLMKDPAQRIADASTIAAATTALLETAELPLLATIAVVPRPTSSFAENEQVLFSVVIAAPSEDKAGDDPVPHEDLLLALEQRQSLQRAIQALGGQADYLASGALVVTVSQSGSATDQAMLAARAALLIKESWPVAEVSLATGRGTKRGCTIVGEVVDRAVRQLQQRSQPDAVGSASHPSGVFLDALSARLLEGRFAQTPDHGGLLLIGAAKEVDASRPLLGKPTPCVGREVELGTLDAQLTACIEESEVRVVLITAAPGAGKSRLRHEFLRRVSQREEAVTVLWGCGGLTSAGAPYGIVGESLRRLCGLSGGEPLDERQKRLRSRLVQRVPQDEQERVVSFLGELCGVAFSSAGNAMLLAAREDPGIMHDCVRRAYLDWLAWECQAAPVLLVLDDLQWGDGLSVRLLEEALRELRAAPLFVLALGRPEVHEAFPKLWQSYRVHEIRLKGLSKKACERLAQQVLGQHVAPEIVGRLAEQSAGNALFLEELIRAVAEGKQNEQPDTVLAMLQARIGRFETGPRRVLRAASVFGKTFWAGGVAAVLGLAIEPRELESWLSVLIDAEVIEPHPARGLTGEKEFGFRHALVRDAAYSLLTESDLATGHRLAGLFLEAAGEQDPATIAEHLDRGGEKARAVSLYCRAAEAAMVKCAPESTLRWAARGVACGAEGELLGMLLSLESFAGYLRGRFDRAFPTGMAALPLLQPGSLAWTYCMSSTCLCAAFGPPEWQRQFPGLAAQLLAAEPAANAEGVYAEAVSHTLATLINVVPWAQILEGLHRLQAICDRAAVRSPAVRRHFLTARGRCLRFAAPRPWQLAQDGLEVVALCQQSGDLRNRHIAVLMERAWSELGDSDLAIQKMTSHPPTEELAALHIGRMFLAVVLANQGDSDAQQRATELAREALAQLGSFPITAIPAHDCLARVLLQQEKLGEAEAEAREACRILAAVPIYFPDARATLIRILLAQGKPADATGVAEDALAIIRHFGCAGSAEIELRLAISEAFHAAADCERARTELRETLHQIQIRASDIPDPFWRQSYLTRNPYCARTQKLAQEWGLDSV